MRYIHDSLLYYVHILYFGFYCALSRLQDQYRNNLYSSKIDITKYLINHVDTCMETAESLQ